jgi:uncharacterized membrane protein YhaH (DUF805 family)
MQAITLQDKLFSFRGRLRRKDFWLYHLVLWSVLVPLGFFAFAWSEEGRTGEARWWSGVMIALVLFGLAQIWPSLAISVKRCHDRNKSGWWVLLWLVLANLPVISILGLAWWFVELGFLDGTQGPNRFGPSPKGLGGERIAEAFT